MVSGEPRTGSKNGSRGAPCLETFQWPKGTAHERETERQNAAGLVLVFTVVLSHAHFWIARVLDQLCERERLAVRTDVLDQEVVDDLHLLPNGLIDLPYLPVSAIVQAMASMTPSLKEKALSSVP